MINRLDYERFKKAVAGFNQLRGKRGHCPLPVFLDDQALEKILQVAPINTDRCMIADTRESIIVATTIENVATQIVSFCGVCLKCAGPLIESRIQGGPFQGGYAIQHYKKPNIE